MKNYEQEIEVLYEDNHLLALFKPAGMLVQGDRTLDRPLLEWARDWIKTRYSKPGRVFLGLVHRLDRPVAGTVLFARTSKAAARLSTHFRNHEVRKVYWAVVHGHPKPPEGSLHAYLRRTGLKTIATAANHPAAKFAELFYKTLQKKQGFTLLEITPLTGRHHQIRAQLAVIGHPILGDRKYGGLLSVASFSIALLAKTITCIHPTRQKEMTFESPVPVDWPWPPPNAAFRHDRIRVSRKETRNGSTSSPS